MLSLELNGRFYPNLYSAALGNGFFLEFGGCLGFFFKSKCQMVDQSIFKFLLLIKEYETWRLATISHFPI